MRQTAPSTRPGAPTHSKLSASGDIASPLFPTVLVVLAVDAALTAIRGVSFLRYVLTPSRYAVPAVVLWLGLSAWSLFLLGRFRAWTAAGFPRKGAAVATVTYAYLVLALGVPLTLDLLAGAGGVGSGADQPNRVFTVIGSTLTVGALLTAVLTIRKIVETRLPAPERRRSAP